MQSSSQIITVNKPTPSFLQAGCPSCRPTNSVKALKGMGRFLTPLKQLTLLPYAVLSIMVDASQHETERWLLTFHKSQS